MPDDQDDIHRMLDEQTTPPSVMSPNRRAERVPSGFMPSDAIPDCDWCGECGWCQQLGRPEPHPHSCRCRDCQSDARMEQEAQA